MSWLVPWFWEASYVSACVQFIKCFLHLYAESSLLVWFFPQLLLFGFEGFFLLNFCFNVMHLSETISHFLELIVGKRWNLLTICYFLMNYFFLHATLWYELLTLALLLWLQGANALLVCHRSHFYQKSLALIKLFLLSLLITTICILLDSPGLWSVVWSGSILSCLSRLLVCFAFLLCSALV